MSKATEKVCEVCKYRNKNIKEEPCWSCCSSEDRPDFVFDADIMKQIHEVPDEPNNNYDSHYNISDHQPIEVMQANMTDDEFIGYLKGNIIKYACRMGRKDDVKKEASKIRRYAEWLEQAVSGETINPRK